MELDHILCPYACSSTNIKGPLGGLNWRQKQPIIQRQEKYMMAEGRVVFISIPLKVAAKGDHERDRV